MNLKHLIIYLAFLFSACQEQKGDYICTPCDLPCDTLTFSAAGICPHCKMKLIHKDDWIDESKLILNEVKLRTGSGVFLMAGTKGRSIKIYYHQPVGFTKAAKILIVVPGAGRNGDSYRDDWIATSELHNVLILSPMFEREDYPFEDYHLCGLIEPSNLKASIEYLAHSNIAQLNEEKFTCQFNSNSEEWIFNSFDDLFELVVQSIGSTQSNYDIFGHSAGGQILHRSVIFSKSKKVNRIIAANSGFYTLPDHETALPFGLKNTILDVVNLEDVFAKKLILLLGELDNENENGGTLLRSKTVDQQGLHRLARGKYFYNFGKNKAEEFDVDFNWQIQVVSNVGHDHGLMAKAAGELLYE